MSILEDIGNVAETPSPSTSLRPRSRLRSSASRTSQRYQGRMREEEEKMAETDESTPPDARATRRRSLRVKPARLTMRDSSAEENEEEEDDDEEIDDDDDNTTVDQEEAARDRDEEEEDDDDQEEEEEQQSRGRYSFRERGSVKKPERFDQSIYDEVFQPMRRFPDAPPSHATRRRDGRDRVDREEKSVRRGVSSQSARSRGKRRRLDDDDDEDAGDEVDELDYATDESDMELIQRRIEEQERAEAAEAAAAVAAVQALESAPRHTRSTRYALRHRDGKESLSPERPRVNERSSSSNRRRSHRSDDKRRLMSRQEVEDDVEDDDHHEEAGNDGRRYYLRQRSHSDLRDQDEERVSVQSNRNNRRNAARNERRDRDHERDRRRRAREEARIMQDGAIAASFGAEENGPRYSLRDRSKVQRSESTLTKDPSLSVYTDYAKRQASRATQRGVGHSFSSSAVRRSSKRSHKRRSDRRRRLSSSSSSNSSDDMFKYYDSDQGGMRAGGGKRRGSGPVDRKRADISPVEVDRSITWDSVGGLEKHIEALKEMVMLPLLYPEFYEKYNVTPPSGVLFYGPPGTGKTLLARALANSCSIEDDSPATQISLDASEVIETKKARNVTFYMRKGADCLSKWVGEAERQLRLLFEEAKRNQPSIIFFDEIDGLAPVRSAKQDQIHASIVSTLLALMDGMDTRGRVVVIGATNRLDAIDPALRRPGRFDRELGFKLPNVSERKRMLEIHTKKWNPPLSEAFVQEIAQRTVGYCGADVKALCAEAALCSLRRVYPQVYGSQDKLLIQLDKIVVSRGDFTKAMKKITPASHRTVSSFASPLPKGVWALLDGSLNAILRKIAEQFPLFPLDSQAIDALNKSDGGAATARPISLDRDEDDENEDDDIYAVMNHDDCDVCHGDEGELLCCDACPGAFHANCLPSDHTRPSSQSTDWFCPDCKDSEKMEALLTAKQQKAQQRQARQMYLLPQLVGFPRVLISGKSGMGQEYIASALLHAMEGLTHFTLDYPSLVADVNTHSAEEALIHRLNEAQKCLPCVIYLPQIDLWWENTPQSMHVALKMMLMNMQIKANLPVLFLATTSSCDFTDLTDSILDLFKHDRTVERSSVTWQLKSVSEAKRKAHFDQAFATIGAAPLPKRKRRRGDEKLEVLPLAPVVKKAKREPTVDELERIREHDLHCLRELRIFLGQVLDYCGGERSYAPFYFPVDPEAIPDYYLIIKNPMDLSTMRERLNDGDYTCFEQFLDDIQLIVRNANMFNPKRSATRHIAQAAGTMKDNIMSFAHRFRKQQGYDLFAKCREITKRLHTNPALYSEVPDVPHPPRLTSKPVPLKPPSRVSDRLRGIQAPELNAEDAPITSQQVSKPTSTNDSSATDSSAVAVREEGTIPQWFHSSPAPSASPEADPTRMVTVDEDTFGTTDSMEISDGNTSVGTQVFEEGDTVFVMARTFPGMNKLGGAGKVVRRNEDGTYNVKFVLGGSEKNVPPLFIRDFTDEAVKESVRNQRSNDHGSLAGKTLASAPKEPPKTNVEIQAEFFDNLVWPILSDEGWTREEMTVVSDDGSTIVMRFVPSKSDDGREEDALEGVDQVLEYINKDRILAVKCFGKRYAEELPTESIFSEKDGETDEPSSENVEQTSDNREPASASASKPSEQAGTSVLTEQSAVLQAGPMEKPDPNGEEAVEVARAFVYDEARMAIALNDLVKKTDGWSVGELRDELLLLNKLAYPYRFEHDRSQLMQVIEEHVATLSR